MQEIDGEYFYLFDYYDGKPLRAEEITQDHCARMGEVLAAIHDTDRKTAQEGYRPVSFDWDRCLPLLERSNRQLFELLRSCRALLEECQERANRAGRRLPRILTVCHNDMDRKNVLWKGSDFRIIDLECLSYNRPATELMDLALRWSGFDECQMDFQRFHAFLQGYVCAGGELPTDWETLYDCDTGRLEWLEYNLKRASGIDRGDGEIQTGMGQAKETIRQIRYHADMRGRILEYCYACRFPTASVTSC